MNVSETDKMAVLVAGLYNPDKEYRATCVQKIAQQGAVASGHLIPLLKDSDWKVRYRAAEALGMIKAGDAVPDLMALCADEKDHVRYMAAKSLGSIRDPCAAPVLISLLTDHHPYTRGVAATGIAAIGGPIGKSEIRSALIKETDPGAREKMESGLHTLD